MSDHLRALATKGNVCLTCLRSRALSGPVSRAGHLRRMPQITDVRERIVNAAEGCFARYGVGKTTVEDIAAAAGLSRATVYRSFAGGRDEVILAVLLRDLRRFLDRLATRLGTETSVPD